MSQLSNPTPNNTSDSKYPLPDSSRRFSLYYRGTQNKRNTYNEVKSLEAIFSDTRKRENNGFFRFFDLASIDDQIPIIARVWH